MKKIVKWAFIASLGFLQFGPLAIAEETSESDSQAEVIFKEDVIFKNMEDKEKQALFESYDKILTSPESDETMDKLSNLEVIDSEKAYQDFMKSTKDNPGIIYFGFQECPYCRAFAPKLNQFAKEHDITIYYYNVYERDQDKTFSDTISTYGIDSVPHAFIVDKEKVDKEFLDSQSTMEEIEAFILKVAK